MNGLLRWWGIVGLVLLGFAASVTAATTNQLSGPLLEGLGTLHFPVETDVPLAQRYFDQGLILAYAFNHKEAIRSFKSAAQLDPNCGMAYWGIAYASGPHVNKPMDAEGNKEAWAALQQALSKISTSSPKQAGMIQALSQRYREQFTEERAELDKAYAAAMRKLAQEYPDDLDIQTLFAEALMDTMPWDYWLKDRSPKPETEEALHALKTVLARDPEHPGANHFFIHAVEAGPTPEIGLPSADRLLSFAPNAGHLVHMPSHIYMRVGQYSDAVAANELAVEADQEYLRQTKAQGFYPGMYYPHNVHFLWWSRLYEGRSKQALATAEEAARYAIDNYCGPNKVVEAPRFRHLPWITLMRFGKWDEILALPKPPSTNGFLMDRAMWHFVRGMAFAARDDAKAAAAEHASLAELTRSDKDEALNTPILPVSSILRVADGWLAARVAEVQKDKEKMVRQFEETIAFEDSIPYMEPAYWPISVRPSYGAALLRTGDAEKAETVFRRDLQEWPRNGWGLLGLEQSLRAQDRHEAADGVRRQFAETWQNADVELQLDWF